MNYLNCPILLKLKKKSEPLISKVEVDNMTDIAQECFDYEFTGESKFYPYELPSILLELNYQSLVIVGASGRGKSTLLKEFNSTSLKEWDNSKAIISNFSSKEEALDRLSSVGLSTVPTWCKPRNVLSVGEGFRADMALNLNSNICFDEFTSTIDRNVAKATCLGINKFIRKHNLQKVVFCSCHKDFIEWLNPDFVIDLDYENLYDCRNSDLSPLADKTEVSLFNNLEKVAEFCL